MGTPSGYEIEEPTLATIANPHKYDRELIPIFIFVVHAVLIGGNEKPV